MFITLYVGLLLCDKDGRSVHPPHHRLSPYTPEVGQLSAPDQQDRPAHPDGLHSTGSSTSRARCKARHTHQNAAPGDRDGGGCWTACNVSGKVYNFGCLFLSIFIWIYFAESIDNPYIYGYNIISPYKYGLQPH